VKLHVFCTVATESVAVYKVFCRHIYILIDYMKE